MIKKLWATKQVYDIIIRVIENRRKSGVYRQDTLQMLLDTGDDNLVAVGVSDCLFYYPVCSLVNDKELTYWIRQPQVYYGVHNCRCSSDRNNRCVGLLFRL